MLRSAMRDEIRAYAEIPGSETMTGLINAAIQDACDAITGLAKYTELFTPGLSLAIAADGIVTLPATVQHYSDTEVYFLRDGSVEIGSRYRLHPFTRSRVTTFGPASQFQFYGVAGAPGTTRIKITPFADISTADDRIALDVWSKISWDSDVGEFPVPKISEVVILRAAAKIARSGNTRLSNKLMTQYREAYIALRAQSPIMV